MSEPAVRVGNSGRELGFLEVISWKKPLMLRAKGLELMGRNRPVGWEDCASKTNTDALKPSSVTLANQSMALS